MPADSRASRYALVVPVLLLLTLPMQDFQGPLHTTATDAVNLLFVPLYWTVLLTRRERPSFPLAAGFWLVIVGSLISLVSTLDRTKAIITTVQDVYLYLWCITLAHFLARYCRLATVAGVWAAVAAVLCVLTIGDNLVGLAGHMLSGMYNRDHGTFGNPNMYGNYLVTSLFVTWALAATGRRWLYWLFIPLLLQIHDTRSNGALVSFLAGTGTVVLVHTLRSIQRTRAVMATGLITAGLLVFTVGFFHDDLVQLAQSVFTAGRGAAVGGVGAAGKGMAERFSLWSEAAQVYQEAPLGVGPGNFMYASGQIAGDYNSAHNDYLGMLVERGPLGLIGWCMMLGGVFWGILRLEAVPLARRVFGIEPMYGAFAAVSAHALVIELSHFRHFWMLLSLLLAAVSQGLATQVVAGAKPAKITPLDRAA